jgi:crotonobetainyl-CoA:carnitine CoA-transferase CaiB-like acyl-CoA transferase
MLEGLQIVDLTSVLFGPFSTQLLADLGADVVKVESLQGDIFRFVGKPAKTRGMGPVHLALNRGKQSAALDLKTEGDLDLMRALLARADIFIHNVRAKPMQRLGLDFAAVQALNPAIIYVHCVGFGSDGPYADAPAYDDVIQAASGATSLPPRADGNPQPRFVPSAIADKVAGLYAANAMLAALFHRQRTGEGQFVEVPMLETFTDFLLKEHLGGLTFDPPNGPPCYQRQIDPCRQPFPTADGHICIVPYADDSWSKVMTILGNPAILEDERFNTPAQRFHNAGLLYREIARLTPAHATAHWIDALRVADIPVMEARDIDDILNEPHLAATGFFSVEEHPTEGTYLGMKPPVRYGAYSYPKRAPAASLGEHNKSIRRSLAWRR